MNNFSVHSILFGKPNFFNEKTLRNSFNNAGVDPFMVGIPSNVDELEELITSFPNLKEIYYINNFVSRKIHKFLNSKEGIYFFIENNIKKVVLVKKRRRKANLCSVYSEQKHWKDSKPSYVYPVAS